MPRELASKEEVEKLLPEAQEIRLVRGKKKKVKNDKDEVEGDQQVKMKLRTERTLYTFKTTEAEAQAIIKGQKIDVVEF
jgi:hypothetical protein